ncbi:RTA1 like protein-domain-containing protein [Pestalotiopsis sp. NC0098]|nr:RTA1 like protein-domain-containing protein [Pestalotiopsis sp. NC0098]
MGLVQFIDGKVVYYPYLPSKAAALAFVALFAVATLSHIGLMIRYRSWFFIPLVIGGICELFGYYGRAWSHDAPNSPKGFMLQLMLILVSPVFIAATIYVTLGKYKQALLGQPKRKCSPTSFFVLTDIVAFFTQIGGSLVQVTGSIKIMEIGDHIVLGGLLFQLVVLLVYLALVVKFHQTCMRYGMVIDGWRPYVLVMIASVVLIWVRNLVRVIEFAQGFYGAITQNEAMIYVFDAFLMLSIMILFAVWHPVRLVRKADGGRYVKGLASQNDNELGSLAYGAEMHSNR